MSLNIQNTTRVFDMNPVLKAMQEYNQTYDQEQAYYDALAQKLGELKSAVQDTTEAKAIYDQYLNDLETATDVFSRGRNISTASDLGRLRRQYGLNVVPLETARTAMLDNVKAINDLRRNHPEMLVQDIGNLDTYLKNPTYSPQTYSKDKLTNDTATMLKTMTQDISSLSLGDAIDKYHNQLVQKVGLSHEQAYNAIKQLKEQGINGVSDALIQGIASSVYDSSGIDNWATDNQKREAWDAIGNGIALGVGTTVRKEMQNLGVLTAAQADSSARDWAQERRAQQQFDIAMEQSGYVYDPRTKKYENTGGLDLEYTLPGGTKLRKEVGKQIWHPIDEKGNIIASEDRGGAGYTRAELVGAYKAADKQNKTSKSSNRVLQYTNPVIINPEGKEQHLSSISSTEGAREINGRQIKVDYKEGNIVISTLDGTQIFKYDPQNHTQTNSGAQSQSAYNSYFGSSSYHQNDTKTLKSLALKAIDLINTQGVESLNSYMIYFQPQSGSGFGNDASATIVPIASKLAPSSQTGTESVIGNSGDSTDNIGM